MDLWTALFKGRGDEDDKSKCEHDWEEVETERKLVSGPTYNEEEGCLEVTTGLAIIEFECADCGETKGSYGPFAPTTFRKDSYRKHSFGETDSWEVEGP